MGKILFLILLCSAVEGDLGEHIFVKEPAETWLAAQTYCRLKYTDLSPVNGQRDSDKIKVAAGGTFVEGWIGLYRDPTGLNLWKWSGGGNATYLNWDAGQPDHGELQDNARMSAHGKWHDVNGLTPLPFYCLSITTVMATKTWEDAMEHCRETDTDLTSLQSETELLLAQRAIRKGNLAERVWIGLRYLHDRWLWVNGDPLVYQAWPQVGDQDHQCPMYKCCGALTIEGQWENLDCEEKLSFICN